jgi:hypothetical protein
MGLQKARDNNPRPREDRDGDFTHSARGWNGCQGRLAVSAPFVVEFVAAGISACPAGAASSTPTACELSWSNDIAEDLEPPPSFHSELNHYLAVSCSYFPTSNFHSPVTCNWTLSRTIPCSLQLSLQFRCGWLWLIYRLWMGYLLRRCRLVHDSRILDVLGLLGIVLRILRILCGGHVDDCRRRTVAVALVGLDAGDNERHEVKDSKGRPS